MTPDSQKILTLFQTKKCHFPHPFSDLEEVTKRNIHVYKDRNYCNIITQIRALTKTRPKWAQSVPVLTPKQRKNHTLWGGTHLHAYGLYKGFSPPPQPGLFSPNYISARFYACIHLSFLVERLEPAKKSMH